MKIGTSWISESQAEANLKKEIGSDDFATVKSKARAIWNAELNRITVEGGSEEQKTIFYSCLYRGLTFPKIMWEEVEGVAKYYSPYDGDIHEGKLVGRQWVLGHLPCGLAVLYDDVSGTDRRDARWLGKFL